MHFSTSLSEEEEDEEEEKERKKGEQFGCLVTFLFGSFAMPFHATTCSGHVFVVMKTLKDEWYVGSSESVEVYH